MTARAERGPQWDVGTQLCVTFRTFVASSKLTKDVYRFHVDQDSDLYYDSTVLAESAKKKLEEENGEEPQTQHQQQHQQQPMPMPMHTPHREPHRPDFSDMRHHDTPPPRAMSHGPSPMNMGGYGGGPYAGGSPMTRGGPPGPYPGNPGAGGIPFNSPSGPYFNGPQHHDNSPMRMGMGNMNMGGPGPMDFQGHGGGMGIPPGMGSSMGNMGGMGPGPGMGGGMPGVMGPPGAMMAPGMPDMRRRVTRGMSEEGYMMH